MVRLSTAQYINGIRSLDNLAGLLREALRRAMPGVRLQREAAYAWRGYQIVDFPGLDARRYYCQVYLGKPNIIAFFEYFEMHPHSFQIDYDLISHNFFSHDRPGQLQMLVDFIVIAHQEAIVWNGSDIRRQIVPERFL